MPIGGNRVGKESDLALEKSLCLRRIFAIRGRGIQGEGEIKEAA